MFRASGTEPVLRIYCEAATEAEVAHLFSSANDYISQMATKDLTPRPKNEFS